MQWSNSKLAATTIKGAVLMVFLGFLAAFCVTDLFDHDRGEPTTAHNPRLIPIDARTPTGYSIRRRGFPKWRSHEASAFSLGCTVR